MVRRRERGRRLLGRLGADELVAGVVEALRGFGFTEVSTVETIKEHMHFVLPAELRR